MERALDPQLLASALGFHTNLPLPEELGRMMGAAEIRLLAGSPPDVSDLEEVGWFLHAVASVPKALEVYGVERQRQAFQVAGHVFDILLRVSPPDGSLLHLQRLFAAQVAFLRSDLTPNNLALYRRSDLPRLDADDFVRSPGLVSLRLASALIATDSQFLFPTIRELGTRVSDLERVFDSRTLSGTLFGPAAGVLDAVRLVHQFLAYGNESRLGEVPSILAASVAEETRPTDLVSRWVAAHLLNLWGGLAEASVWRVLPPDVPIGVKRAFSQGHPRVSILWPPQIDALSGATSLLGGSLKRAIVAMPTSAGKTLMAQLLIATHLSQGRGGICYIAPTRSLCSEVRRSLDQRLRYLDLSVVSDLPVSFDSEDDRLLGEPSIEVMTPERLAFQLRADPDGLLERFSLFVFDEVHTVGDPGRGWTLEAGLSFLHAATLSTDHVIVGLSAALGNRAHFVSWLAGGETAVADFHANWRGPRRLTCIWTTEADWRAGVEASRKSDDRPVRVTYPLRGALHVRTGASGVHQKLTTSEPVGQLAFAEGLGVDRKREPSPHSTPFYQMLVPLIQTLERTGPVLVIEGTRANTVRLAKVTADALPEREDEAIRALQTFVRTRLGDVHPLTAVIGRGVAYHHGSLPLDVRGVIEDAVRDGIIPILVATTSMTEGVNLPVRSVIVARQGTGGGADLVEYIRGSRLMNAIGRAGRAGIETEGTVVLARQSQFEATDFALLDPTDEELTILSSLASEAALEDLAALESAYADERDSIFVFRPGPASDFVSFVWFLASRIETDDDVDSVATFLRRTLAWEQLTASQRERIERIAEFAERAYADTSPTRRRRWAKSGLSLSDASILDRLAEEIASLRDVTLETDPTEAIRSTLAANRLEQLLELPGAPRTLVRPYRSSPLDRARQLDVHSLLSDWIGGVEYGELSTRHLSEITDPEYRAEQLGDFIGSLFENFLPWVLGVVVAWANEIRLDEAPLDDELPTDLPLFVRFGVDSPAALNLMINGLQSRRLAHAVADAYTADGVEQPVVDWLRTMQIDEWRMRFVASPSELLELLSLLRIRGVGIAAAVLAGREASIPLSESAATHPPEDVVIRQTAGEPPRQLGLWSESDSNLLIDVIPPAYHGEVEALVATTLELSSRLEHSATGPVLTLSLSEAGQVA